ncbi:DUF4386 family protein [Micromonospora sp. DR5-3]|uniref:DUF4386 family protein n=1 Tax=unclassified Micromonospora TaxID=2617518 RepID=UPI0011D73C1D|nr:MULTISPECIES: DUF4386 family protein [unclassified Micromonospora]MCW3814059.1 DUF4386 family protein [Micromonospora sp. DR5-3]TYC23592.1 DUF4386 family protein [Micromonospora sp. MP36]
MTVGISSDGTQGRALRVAALGGLGFDALYVAHRLLQGFGPEASTADAIAAYQTDHRGALLGSEVAVGIALLAVVVFLAPLVPAIWRAGQEALATAVLISGVAFIAMGFLSLAAETALVGVADSDQPAAVLVLNELQGRTPVVWTITALTATISLAVLRTHLLPKWLGIAGVVAAAVFLLGSIFSVLGRTAEGNSSLFGIGLFVVWMLALSIALWRAASYRDRPLS